MGGPASSYATAGIALRVISILKPPHHDKVETPRGGFSDGEGIEIFKFQNL
jgi:hypothetical protein